MGKLGIFRVSEIVQQHPRRVSCIFSLRAYPACLFSFRLWMDAIIIKIQLDARTLLEMQSIFVHFQTVFLYCCLDLPKVPNQCYLDKPGDLGNQGRSKEIQPHFSSALSPVLMEYLCGYDVMKTQLISGTVDKEAAHQLARNLAQIHIATHRNTLSEDDFNKMKDKFT